MNKKPKIAMIGVRGIPAKMGGAESVVENIAIRLAKDCEITVFCRPDYFKKNTPLPSEFKGVRLRFVRTINTKHLEAIIHTFFSSILAAFGPYDIVHYHSIGPSLLSWLPRLFGKKVIATCHALDWRREKWGKKATGFLKLGAWASARFPQITTVVSKDIQDFYQYNLNKGTILVNNGVNTGNSSTFSSIIDDFSFTSGQYILFLSRIVPEKRLDLLINAYLPLNTEYKLVITGDSSHSQEYVEELRKLTKDNKKIIFTGQQTGADKDTLLQNCALFVLPSDLEGMPIVLLEALSCGCACIASDIKVNRGLLEPEPGQKYGELFKQGDTEDLKEKLELLLNNKPLREQYRSLGHEYIKQNYNWDDIAGEYLKLYKSLSSG
ncbi:glycosyltransferase family 4 protein [Candidatus Margulisiibacteriota bacterium]